MRIRKIQKPRSAWLRSADEAAWGNCPRCGVGMILSYLGDQVLSKNIHMPPISFWDLNLWRQSKLLQRFRKNLYPILLSPPFCLKSFSSWKHQNRDGS